MSKDWSRLRPRGRLLWVLQAGACAAILFFSINLVAKVAIVAAHGYWPMLGQVLLSWRTPVLAILLLFAWLISGRGGKAEGPARLGGGAGPWLTGLGVCGLVAIVGFVDGVLTPANPLGLSVDRPSATFWVDRDHPQRPPAQVTTNSYGFRDSEWGREPPAGTIRVLVVGDSYVYGKGVPEAEGLIDRRLEAQLSEDSPGRRWEVLNLGYPGHGLLTHFALARRAIEELQPRVLVIGSLGTSDWHLFERQEQHRAFGHHGYSMLSAFGVTYDLDLASILYSESAFPQDRSALGGDRIAARMAALLECATENDVDVVIWEYYEPLPFHAGLAGHERLHLTGWPEGFPRTRDGWGTDRRLAIPVDRHPTAAANALIARHLAPTLLEIVDAGGG